MPTRKEKEVAAWSRRRKLLKEARERGGLTLAEGQHLCKGVSKRQVGYYFWHLTQLGELVYDRREREYQPVRPYGMITGVVRPPPPPRKKVWEDERSK